MTLEEALEKLQEEICAHNRMLSCYRSSIQDQVDVAQLNCKGNSTATVDEQAYCEGAFDMIRRLQKQFEVFFPR